MRSDLISVVIPTHDRRELLAVTLASVLRQGDGECEGVVVDDGSTDATQQFLAGLRDPRVRWITNPAPRGVTTARNQGIEATTGVWLGFVDDDDVWAPDKLV